MNATTIKTVHGWYGIESWHAAILDGTDIVWQSWTDYTDQERAYNVSLDKLKELTP
jgi:hypothetical protein